MTGFQQQYAFVQSSREALLTYGATISSRDLIASIAAFNNGSIRNLFVHVANVYRHWTERIARKHHIPYFENDSVRDLADIRRMFSETDAAMQTFIDVFADQWLTDLSWTIPGREVLVDASPFKIFTHVITHEFHHKGQILAMSRQLGYAPPDTDIIRF